MSASAWLQLGTLVAAIAVVTPLLGSYLARVFGGGSAPGDRVFAPVERLVFRLVGVDPDSEQRWPTYASSVIAFSVASVALLYILQRTQAWLPMNPTGVGAVSPGVAFNTAVSFVTNTNWQVYGGESTMSQFTQMAGLAVQNFASAAVGMAVAIALVRGLTRRRSATIGNFWVDLIKGLVRVLLPIAALGALALVSQGVIQNFTGSTAAHSVAGGTQSIPGGPVASQEAIKVLGTNGGGYFNANSAHPFENPNGLTNLLEILLVLMIPFALTYTFGTFAKNRRQGWTLFAAMFLLWSGGTFAVTHFETSGNRSLHGTGVTQQLTSGQSGGNLEGKEVRFGSAGSALLADAATGTSTGAANSAYNSYTPAGGGTLLVNMMLGEVAPGGIGSGLYGLLILALLAVFIAGLMVGRTPEFLGKKIQAAEMKLAMLCILVMPTIVLAFAGASMVLGAGAGTGSIANPGPHGLTEVVYAFTSTANNNGSGFGGLNTATPWYETMLGLAMLAGRFLIIVPVLAIAGSLGAKRRVPATSGTFRTDTPLFTGLLIGVVIVVGALTFLPVLSLGPIAEALGQ